MTMICDRLCGIPQLCPDDRAPHILGSNATLGVVEYLQLQL